MTWSSAICQPPVPREDLIITPDLKAVEWNGFDVGRELLNAGEEAALAALPAIQSRLSDHGSRVAAATIRESLA